MHNLISYVCKVSRCAHSYTCIHYIHYIYVQVIDPRFLLQLTNVLFGGISLSSGLHHRPDDKEVSAVGAACAFLHVSLNTLPLEGIMTILAYRTELVPVLWNFMKRCHENQKWQSVSEQLAYLLPGDSPGWLLALAVFCPVYKHMLTVVDNEEFYEQEKPLSLKDIRYLVIILRQALWQLLWVNPTAPSNSSKPVTTTSSKKHPVELIQHRVSIVASELLSQLQDWNNRREFTSPSDFHADGVNEFFITQAIIENTRANDIMKHAPFLVPFTSRVKIFASQLAAARQRHESNSVFTRNRFRIRRDRILEDAYDQMSALSEDDLRGPIRVTFVNEFGVEEGGIDGGGIFKDFMENITRAAFDVQHGLFKTSRFYMRKKGNHSIKKRGTTDTAGLQLRTKISMTFSHLLKALCLRNNNTTPDSPSCNYNPNHEISTTPAPNSPHFITGDPANNEAAPTAPDYHCPTQAAPCTDVPSFVPHDDGVDCECLKPPGQDIGSCSSSSAGLHDQPAATPPPLMPMNTNEKGKGKKKGKKKSTSGRSAGNVFEVRGNTITGCKGGKVGIFDFGNTCT
ncbi:hypothetical protein ACFX1T_021754 [Malus domestica]